DALKDRIGAQQAALQLSEAEQTETTAWWVHIPDMQTRQLAERKQAELRALGVREMIVMADPSDSQKLAVSLGLFKTEAAAKELLATLSGQGVRSARIAPREGRAGRYRIEVRGAGPDLTDLFDNLPALDDTVQRTDCQ
ncbi:MAG: SPOR domain-containing protein, partial [Methyloversatilis sp. 12-65-5]